MKNRVLGMAIAASILAPVFVGNGPMRALQVQPTPKPGGAVAPAGGIGSMLGDVARRQTVGGSNGFYKPRYRKERGPGHRAAKRIKRRARNRLRAKGQFRKAVR